MGDTRGKGYQEPAIENPAYEPLKEMGDVPEKDPGRTLSKNRLSGSTPAASQKVRKFPSQR